MERSLARHGLRAATALLPAAFILVSACGTDEGTDTISADRFPSAYAQALCGSLQHCCDENQVAENFNSCTAGWRSYVEKLLASPAALTNYEPRVAKACVDAIRTAASVSCQPVPTSISDARDTCMRIFVGKKAIGQPCGTAGECAPDPNGGRVGCEVPPEKNEGGVLPLTVQPLDVAPLAPSDLLDLHPLAIATPVCTLVGSAPAGAPCLIDPKSVRSNCDASSYCNPKNTQCAPLGEIAAECVPGSCKAGGVCATTGPNAGKCVPTSPLGGSCTSLAECDATTRCDLGTSTCVAKKESGQPCADDSECNVGTCDVGTKKCLKNSIATTDTCNGKTG